MMSDTDRGFVSRADRTTRERLEQALTRLSIGERAGLQVDLLLASEYVLDNEMAKAAESLDRTLEGLGILPVWGKEGP